MVPVEDVEVVRKELVARPGGAELARGRGVWVCKVTTNGIDILSHVFAARLTRRRGECD